MTKSPLVCKYGEDASQQFLATTLLFGAHHVKGIRTDPFSQDTDLKCIPFNVDTSEVGAEIDRWMNSLWCR
jgi:hypothetical protein